MDPVLAWNGTSILFSKKTLFQNLKGMICMHVDLKNENNDFCSSLSVNTLYTSETFSASFIPTEQKLRKL